MVSSTLFAASAAALLFTAAAKAQQFVMYTPGGDDTVVERFDAILSPGQISQHVHQIFGSDAMDPSMTYDSLQSDTTCTTVGDAEGDGNADDKSVYWHPALYMEAIDGSGYVRIPTNGHKMYYLDSGSDKDEKVSPFEYPKNFRMLANNPFVREAYADVHMQNITQWICHTSTNMNQGTDGGFPNHVTDCDAYPGFNGAINFPHCWNGDDFNQSDPTAHMAYPSPDIVHGDCPSTHPKRVPHLFIENQFDLHSMQGKVKDNTFVLAQGDNTGYGFHADFYSGWNPGAVSSLLSTGCYNQGKYGNEDVGNCQGLKRASVATKDCKLKSHFKENVDTPGQFLPGCNPIIDTNPAPIMAIAALGVSSDSCAPAGSYNVTPSNGGAGGAVSSVLSAVTSLLPTLGLGTSSAAAAASSTTMATSIKTTASSAPTATSSAAAAPAYGSSSSSSNKGSTTTPLCPAQNGQSFTDPTSGKSFTIECGVDHQAGDLAAKQVADLAACIAECAKTDGCVDVSLSGVACYLKKSLGAAQNNAGVQGARLAGASSAAASSTAAAAATTMAPANYNHAVNAEAAGSVSTVTSNGAVVVVTDWVYATETATTTQVVKARHAHALVHARGGKGYAGHFPF